MVIEAARQAIRTNHWQPFSLVLTDGRRLPVEKSSYLAVSPTNRFVVYSSNEGFEIIRSELLKDISFDAMTPPGSSSAA